MKKSKKTKEQIIHSARKLFSQEGYEAVSVDRIVAEAGQAKGTFYYYFPSKEDLLLDLIRTEMEEIFDGMEKLTRDPSLGILEKLENFCAFLFSPRTQLKSVQTYLKDADLSAYQANLDALRLERLLPLMENLVTQGLGKGEFRVSSPAVVVPVLVYGINGYMQQHYDSLSAPQVYQSVLVGFTEMFNKILQPGTRPIAFDMPHQPKENYP